MTQKNTQRKVTVIMMMMILGVLATIGSTRAILNKSPNKSKVFLRNQNDQESVLEERPVLIGILTQPKSRLNTNTFSQDQYILSVNKEYIETSGMVKAVPIYYDMQEDELFSLLEKIDGVHFTGGGLDLYNFTTNEWHPYYTTSRRIFDYATKNRALQNSTHHRQFLVTGICQGFELLGMLAAEDKHDLLRVLEYDNIQRPVFWEYNSTHEIKKESKMFANFEPSLLHTMTDQPYAFHYHTYGISVEDYESIQPLKNFFKVISTDRTVRGEPFLTGLEAHDYPIFALMYHPEYQMLEFLSEATFNTIDNQVTQEIIEHMGQFYYDQVLHIRKINKQVHGKDYHSPISLEDIDQLWGHVEPYKITSQILIEAFAVPTTSKVQEVILSNL